MSAGRPQRVPWAGPLGLHRPGTSPVHRAPAGLKLVLLAAVGAVLVVRTGPVVAAVGLLVVIALGVVARTPWRTSTRGLVPVLLTAAALGGYQTWARGAAYGAEVALDLLTLVLAGTLVTTTTRADDLLTVVARAARPLRHVGLPPETVALTVGLFLRTVPVLVRVTGEARDAARARGLERDPRAVVVPAAVRMVGHARTTGDALAARGLGD
ncbi:energy-coupling factor transporter transmembrane protein EcfT [Cellulomonas sp. KH9]|uniref:energy-coupling factor transporter transmembrane component T family protein n=1 Tax=Cellulomonas sp. KH9 TaxID=1855324 RepID=UPI0008E03E70|nr:energy-coupling factor transporter transmembrane protein EcfT [Cellulomonas sp. KH9]SFJ93499.1 biotin transport system permease protein [Cellulomonas sp. KH9]